MFVFLIRIPSSGSDNQHEVVDKNFIQWTFDECTEMGATTSEAFAPLRESQPTKDDILFPFVRKEKVFKDNSTEPKEILGPASDVQGHPIRVSLAGLYSVGIAVDGELLEVRAVTMLYRRFRAEQLRREDINSASLHTLQLLPTYTKGVCLCSPCRLPHSGSFHTPTPWHMFSYDCIPKVVAAVVTKAKLSPMNW